MAQQADLEELEAIRAYDAAKASRDEAIPFEQAIRGIAGTSTADAPEPLHFDASFKSQL